MFLDFIFLSTAFFTQYDRKTYVEILIKDDRPFCMVKVQIDDNTFAIPFRSNINHPNAFLTDKQNKCGIDFSKAVIINDEKFIDRSTDPYIRPNELREIRGKDHNVVVGMKSFIQLYKKANLRKDIKRNKILCKFSTLQYFHKELGIK